MKKILFATENESKAKRFKEGLLENNKELQEDESDVVKFISSNI
jgi:inosine/xanthosine triphosphate pyrophosphatase family protein